jgi:peptidoglycan lytic transglycosylase G
MSRDGRRGDSIQDESYPPGDNGHQPWLRRGQTPPGHSGPAGYEMAPDHPSNPTSGSSWHMQPGDYGGTDPYGPAGHDTPPPGRPQPGGDPYAEDPYATGPTSAVPSQGAPATGGGRRGRTGRHSAPDPYAPPDPYQPAGPYPGGGAPRPAARPSRDPYGGRDPLDPSVPFVPDGPDGAGYGPAGYGAPGGQEPGPPGGAGRHGGYRGEPGPYGGAATTARRPGPAGYDHYGPPGDQYPGGHGAGSPEAGGYAPGGYDPYGTGPGGYPPAGPGYGPADGGYDRYGPPGDYPSSPGGYPPARQAAGGYDPYGTGPGGYPPAGYGPGGQDTAAYRRDGQPAGGYPASDYPSGPMGPGGPAGDYPSGPQPRSGLQGDYPPGPPRPSGPPGDYPSSPGGYPPAGYRADGPPAGYGTGGYRPGDDPAGGYGGPPGGYRPAGDGGQNGPPAAGQAGPGPAAFQRGEDDDYLPGLPDYPDDGPGPAPGAARRPAPGLLPGSDIGADDGGDDGGAGRRSRRDRGKGGPPGGGKPRRRSGWLAGLIAIVVIISGLSVIGFYGFRYIEAKYHPPNFTGAGHGSVTFQVFSGDTPISIAPRLVKAGVVASTQAFVSAAKGSTSGKQLEPGYFRLRKQMNADAAWNLLVSQTTRIQTTVTIPEGLRLSQIIAKLGSSTASSASAYAAAAKNVAALGLPSYAGGHLEGYLFPATYQVQPGMSATDVLKMMVTRFNQESDSISLPAAARAGQVPVAHVMVIASLIQAEGGQLSDFPKIAEVIYNRLNHNMKLELDSTVEYALGKYGIIATNDQLQVNSPFNTYLHTGLPPTPIDSPGKDAIEAALHPAHGDLLYFVTVDPKHHITKFTDSAAEFAKLRQELERNLGQG